MSSIGRDNSDGRFASISVRLHPRGRSFRQSELPRAIGVHIRGIEAHLDAASGWNETFSGPSYCQQLSARVIVFPACQAVTRHRCMATRLAAYYWANDRSPYGLSDACQSPASRDARRQASEKPGRRKPRREFAPAVLSGYGDLAPAFDLVVRCRIGRAARERCEGGVGRSGCGRKSDVAAGDLRFGD
jgi:hypothetical protein